MSTYPSCLSATLKRGAAAACLLLVLTLTGCDANGPAFDDRAALMQAAATTAQTHDNRTAKSRHRTQRGDGNPGPSAQTDAHPQ